MLRKAKLLTRPQQVPRRTLGRTTAAHLFRKEWQGFSEARRASLVWRRGGVNSEFQPGPKAKPIHLQIQFFGAILASYKRIWPAGGYAGIEDPSIAECN